MPMPRELQHFKAAKYGANDWWYKIRWYESSTALRGAASLDLATMNESLHLEE